MLVTQPTPGTLPLTLARLTGEFLDLANVLADTDPSDAEALAQVHDLLDQSVTAIQGKAGSIAALIREFDARADAAQDEVDRITVLMRSARSHGTWLREYLLQHLQALGVDRIETATALIVVRKSPPAVQIIDEALIPDAFIRVVKSVDRSLLRTALLSEKEIPGARLTHGSHLWMR